MVSIDASYNPLLEPSGRVSKVVKFATDITGRVHAVTEIGAGLGKLVEGDLVCEIAQPFIPSLDRLRLDFNNSIATLRGAMQAVGRNAFSIDAAAAEVSSAASLLQADAAAISGDEPAPE